MTGKRGEARVRKDRYGAGHHVTEIYSPPRVTSWAAMMRLVPGLALDLTCKVPEDGLPWGFNNPDTVAKADRLSQATHRCS